MSFDLEIPLQATAFKSSEVARVIANHTDDGKVVRYTIYSVDGREIKLSPREYQHIQAVSKAHDNRGKIMLEDNEMQTSESNREEQFELAKQSAIGHGSSTIKAWYDEKHDKLRYEFIPNESARKAIEEQKAAENK